MEVIMTLGFYKCGKCNAPLGTIRPSECSFCGGPVETVWTVQPPWESLGNTGQPSRSGTAVAQRSEPIPTQVAPAIYQMLLSNLLMTNALKASGTKPKIPRTKRPSDHQPGQFPRADFITGYIDFLQVRDGYLHILDYKPDARKEKDAHV